MFHSFPGPKFSGTQIFPDPENYFRPQKYSGPNILILKVQLFKKKNRNQQSHRENIFWEPTFSEPKFSGHKILKPQNIWDPKFFKPQNFLEPKHQNFFDPTFFLTKIFLNHFFFCFLTLSFKPKIIGTQFLFLKKMGPKFFWTSQFWSQNILDLLNCNLTPFEQTFVKLQPDLEPNLNELEQTWTSRVRSWLCFPMSQQQEQEKPHLILPYRKGL